MKDYKFNFEQQKFMAGRRGIAFTLTFKQWMRIWERSGHLSERGRKCGQYVMARKKDAGPYAVGNVEIILASKNVSDSRKGAAPWNKGKKGLQRCTPETRLKMSVSRTGQKRSPESRRNIANGKRRWHAERKKRGLRPNQDDRGRFCSAENSVV